MEKKLEDVQEFWNANPCDSWWSDLTEAKAYYQDIENKRYTSVRFIPEAAEFEKFKGKKVLEIGCGIATDGRQFAKNGAEYFGINLDAGSTKMAQDAFQTFGLTGNIQQMNAEQLSFPDEFFDHIYSFGVIHHTENPENIAKQMLRVLKKNGTFTVMLYNRNSVNYYFEILFLRKISRILLLPKFSPKVLAKILRVNPAKLERHREIFLKEKMTKERWLSINTDGPDNPISRVYNDAEAKKLFTDAGFSDVNTYVRYFNKDHYSFLGKLIPNKIEDMIGNRWGWHRMIKGKK